MNIYSFISAFAAGFAVATLYYLGITTYYNSLPHFRNVTKMVSNPKKSIKNWRFIRIDAENAVNAHYVQEPVYEFVLETKQYVIWKEVTGGHFMGKYNCQKYDVNKNMYTYYVTTITELPLDVLNAFRLKFSIEE